MKRRPTALPPGTYPQRVAAVRAALALEASGHAPKEVLSALVRSINALEGCAEPQVLEVLQDAYAVTLNPWGQIRAAHAIASLPDERRFAFLRAEMHAPMWRVRMICVRALAGRPTDTALVLRALQDEQWRVRDAAARALARSEPSDLILDSLTVTLNDEDARVAATAERALDRLRRSARTGEA